MIRGISFTDAQNSEPLLSFDKAGSTAARS
jgi:hypothetical protein